MNDALVQEALDRATRLEEHDGRVYLSPNSTAKLLRKLANALEAKEKK
jgi:hypothetical protein